MRSKYYTQWIEMGNQTKSAGDYAAQWLAHNMAYECIPITRSHTADVDFKADEWLDPLWRYIG